MPGEDGTTGLEVAIIGMAGRFPGAASTAEFWEVVSAGQETICQFSQAEVEAAGVPADTASRSGYVKAGGLLADVEYFDSEFFGYSPRDAALLDPQQRVFLESAWAAMEEAGYAIEHYDGLAGVYASVSQSTYLIHQLRAGAGPLTGVGLHELLLANDKDTLATRVAYHLDLRGPALTVQSGCSSSLVAIHLACQALLNGECDIALAGGVSVHIPQREGYRAQAGGVLSTDGHCYPFDSRANGTVNGEGVAIVVLKPLAEALADRDTIHAVIIGSAVNNDGGRKVGFTAPRSGGQSAVIRMAHQVAGVPTATISYVEAHGTGTALGDPIEFAALADVFGAASPEPQYCALGSVKALTGHLDAAAGAAGLIKTVLALKNRALPPSPYFRRSNPEIELESSPFHLPVELAPWPWKGQPRRAAVSSFGMGGTNAHVVLEEAPEAAAPQPGARPAQLLTLSADTEQALTETASRLGRFLRGGSTEADLADIAFTCHISRRARRYRLAVVCRSREEAAELLAASGPRAHDTSGATSARHDRQVVFLFPGQGAQHPAMGQGLYQAEPVFRRWFDICADLVAEQVGADLRSLVHRVANGPPELLDRTEFAQVALFATEYALAQTWLAWGVRPAAMMGHSLGEYTAACLAGTFELADAIRLVAARGLLMQSLPAGVMAAVPMASSQLEPLLSAGVSLAASNSSELSVISGPAEPLADTLSELRRRGMSHSRLRTSHAFHSAMMEPILGEFSTLVRDTAPQPPSIPFVSNLTGRWITDEEAASPDYWARHLRETVRFHEGMELLLDAQDRILLEVGPGTVLTTLARRHDLSTGRHVAIPSLGRPERCEDDSVAVLNAVGALWLSGTEIDWPGFWADERRGRVPLPTYPFARRRHWLDAGSAGTAGASAAGHPDPVVGNSAGSGPKPAAPRSAQECVLAIWRELLGTTQISPADDFFTLGGHSLLATQVTARIYDELGVELPPALLFQATTLAEFTELVGRYGRDDQEPPADLLAEIGKLPEEDKWALLGGAHD